MNPLTVLDQLPILPKEVTVHQFSSHNKKGFNGDAGWFLHKDKHGDAVVFDVEGPGCIRSMWQTCIPADNKYKFYFDGEEKPRYVIPGYELYSGKHPLFPAPLSVTKTTGRYAGPQISENSFVPIPFARSLKITMEGEISFFHFIYERYAAGTKVKTFSEKDKNRDLLKVFKLQGEELVPDANVKVTTVEVEELAPGAVMELLHVEEAGVVKRIVIESDGSPEFLQGVEIEMTWDDAPTLDVIAPVGTFFACPKKAEDVRALPLKVEKINDGMVRMTSYFRMPFWHKAHIRLVNRMNQPALTSGPIKVEIHVAPQTYNEADAAYFTTFYRRGRTVMGKDWTFFDAVGSGWFVGAVQTMHGGHYCEGDEHYTIDGAGMPQINGTGTEDFYLACLWPNVNFNFPYAGCVGDAWIEGGGHMRGSYHADACYYRFHLEAPIPFYSSINACIQHGGINNTVSEYSSLGFGYLRKRTLLAQTDFIDVANPTSEAAHNYTAGKSKPTGDIEACYEGNNFQTVIRDQGRSHKSGEISFTVAINPNNNGVRLRRRLDQKSPRQYAEVFVDGAAAGIWYHPDENEFLRWFDSEFEIHPKHTQGKEKLEIRLAVKADEGYGAWTDFRYDVFSYEDRK
jgi:hypothetical protein